MTQEQFNKLPKWARDHIKDLKRERDVAVRELNEWVDSQTPSKMYVDEMVCTGEERGPSVKRRYIQGETFEVENAGVHLRIELYHNDKIGISWSGPRNSSEDIAFVPESFQRARLVARTHMYPRCTQ